MTRSDQLSKDDFHSLLPLVRHILRSFHISGSTADEIILESFLKLSEVSQEHQLNRAELLLINARTLCLQASRNQIAEAFGEIPELGADVGFWFDQQTECSDIQLEFNSVLVGSLLVHYPIEPRRSIAARYYLEAKSVADISKELKISAARTVQELLQFRADLKYALLELRAEAPKEPKRPQHLRVI